MSIVKNFLFYLFASMLLILLYIELSHYFVNCGGISSKIKSLEIPFLFILLSLLYFPAKSLYKTILFAVIPIIGLYLMYDIFYYFLARSPRVSDIVNVAVIKDFSLPISLGFFAMVLLIVGSIFYLIYSYKKRVSPKDFYITLLIKILAIFSLLYFLNSEFFQKYFFKRFNYFSWSQSRTIRKNGRFSSFLYYHYKHKNAKKKLLTFKEKNINVNKILFKNISLKEKSNIYIVILESFIDPRLIKNATFNRTPLAKNMQKYLINRNFSYTISPIYGGGTSQAEFEILTAIPALAKVNSIEFNSLEGNQIPGFVNLLKQNGYHTYANIATFSGYYNSKDAYKSIGFDNIDFLEESRDFTKREGDKHIFDGDVYNYIIKKIDKKYYKKPYLLYLLGMYGHFPYDRNKKLRPDIIKTNYKDKRISKIANQFYYRTKALGEYIDKILLKDPHSIIFVSSDHLPPLLNHGVEYKRTSKENIALLLVNGKAVDIDGFNYYEIPRIIINLLNNKSKQIKKIEDKKLEDLYFKTISDGIN